MANPLFQNPFTSGFKLGEWKNLNDGRFKGFTFHYATPKGVGDGLTSETILHERRLQFIKRPGVDGAKIRDQGGNGEIYELEIVFFGPDYQDRYKAFKDLLDEGTSGTLYLPDVKTAITAFYWKRSEVATAMAGNSKVVRVTFAQDGYPTPPAKLGISSSGFSKLSGLAGKLASISDSIAEAQSGLSDKIASATAILRDNPILTAIATVETAISTVRSAVNTISQLDRGIRNRIIQFVANISGTMDLIKQTLAEVASDFKGGSSSGISKAASGVDPDTGQRYSSLDLAETQAPADALAPPQVASNVSLPAGVPKSPAAIQAFSSQATAALEANRDQLLSDLGGRVDDVGAAVTDVITALAVFTSIVAPTPSSYVVLPQTLSLLEVLFQNGIDVSHLRTVHQLNASLQDLLAIPQGTVVALP